MLKLKRSFVVPHPSFSFWEMPPLSPYPSPFTIGLGHIYHRLPGKGKALHTWAFSRTLGIFGLCHLLSTGRKHSFCKAGSLLGQVTSWGQKVASLLPPVVISKLSQAKDTPLSRMIKPENFRFSLDHLYSLFRLIRQ